MPLDAFKQTLAAGAIWNSDNGSRSGSVRVFQYNGSDWEQLGDDLYGDKEGDWFGHGVALSRNGRVLAAGAICRNNGGQGYLKVFHLTSHKEIQ